MYPELYESNTFKVLVPPEPFVDRIEGGHLIIYSKLPVSDRTKLDREQAIEYIKVSMIVGEALTLGLAQQGITVGIVNYQEMGNWSVHKPGGPTLHMHVFGRAIDAQRQQYGEAVRLPRRETGFYDGFEPLNDSDMNLIKTAIQTIESSSKYAAF